MHPEHLRCDSVYPSGLGSWNGWMARGLLHCLHLLYYSKLLYLIISKAEVPSL